MSEAAAAGAAELDPAWQGRFVEMVRAFSARLGPWLRPHFEALLQRQRVLRGGYPTFFYHPRSLPVALLPLWVAGSAERLGRPIPQAAVEAACEASILGYLHVRLQDDLLDDGLGEVGPTMMLAEALLVRHQRLVAELVGEADFFALFEEVWVGYAEAMVQEQALFRAGGVGDWHTFHEVLRRSRPLVLPAAALLHRAGMRGRIPELDRWVKHSVAAHQIYVDVLDAEADLAQGNHTPVVVENRGDGSAQALRHNLYAGGGLNRLQALVEVELDAAAQSAHALDLPEAQAWVDARRGTIEALKLAAQQAALKTLLARLTDAG